MTWRVIFHEAFERELADMPEPVQDVFAERLVLLRSEGPRLRRPYADTLNGSRYANMKELRFDVAGGVWRVAFAFDPDRQAIVLVAGDKAGQDQRRFYRRLIRIADTRYGEHLAKL